MVKITKTTTEKGPNAMATAPSSGSDLNGMAALDACKQTKARLVASAAERWGVAPHRGVLSPNKVRVGERWMTFPELVAEAYEARVQLSATGFYKTPKINWDRATGRGRPFYYYGYGAACSELVSDWTRGFNMRLAERSVNRERTIRRSKAVGEPSSMLGISAFEALSMTVTSVADCRLCPRLDAPATPERVLLAMERLRRV